MYHISFIPKSTWQLHNAINSFVYNITKVKFLGLTLRNTGLLSKPTPVTYIIYIKSVHAYAFNEIVAGVAGSLPSSYARSPTD